MQLCFQTHSLSLPFKYAVSFTFIPRDENNWGRLLEKTFLKKLEGQKDRVNCDEQRERE